MIRSAFIFITVVLSIAGQAQTTGTASANGTCNLANTGSNNNKIVIECGIGREQGDEILMMLKKIMAAQDPNKVLVKLEPKLDEILAAESKPSVKQDCVGSNCFAGTNNGTLTQNLNQYGAPKLFLTDAQKDSICIAMKPFAGTSVTVNTSLSEPDSAEFGHRLAEALRCAGLTVIPDDAWSLVIAGVPASGVSFMFTDDMQSAATMLAETMHQTGVTKEKIPASISTRSSLDRSVFNVVVQPNK